MLRSCCLTKVSGGTTTSTVPSGSNKVSAVGGTSIVYNSAGAFTSYGSTAYNWNATGQISFISTSGSTVGTYTYNASNQRTKKVAGGNTTHYVYGLGGLLYGEYDGSGALIREYVYQNGAPLAQIDAGSPEVLTYLHTDHLGTPKYGTNSGGTSVWAANTDPFGVGTPSGSRTVNLRMAGQYYDSESGLFYNWNRYYHPALGRYISSDPIGLAGGPNTFNYANVSPVMFTDPEGLQSGQIPSSWNQPWVHVTPPNPITIEDVQDVLTDVAEIGVAVFTPPPIKGARVLYTIGRAASKVGETQSSTTTCNNCATGSRNRQQPVPNAVGAHTTFRREGGEGSTGPVTHYETYNPQSNPRNPNPWESEKRFDRTGDPHYNKATKQDVPTPHIQSKSTPGGVRPAQPEEIPK